MLYGTFGGMNDRFGKLNLFPIETIVDDIFCIIYYLL